MSRRGDAGSLCLRARACGAERARDALMTVITTTDSLRITAPPVVVNVGKKT